MKMLPSRAQQRIKMVGLIHWGCNLLHCSKEEQLILKPEQCPDILQAPHMWTFLISNVSQHSKALR